MKIAELTLEEFISVWQTSSTIYEVMEYTSLSYGAVFSRVTRYRKKGISLKYFRYGMTIKYVCLECGNSYYVRPCRIDTSRFCGISCQRKYKAHSLSERYWAKVDKRSPDECWPWLGTKDKDGYGSIRPAPDKNSERAHRVGYELKHGPMPKGMLVCHSCDNPPCQNPAHWFIGTNDDNMADMVAKGRHRGNRGDGDNCSAKLTRQQVLEIFYLRGKERQKITAAHYGIHQRHVSAIQRKIAWTWLLGEL